VRALAVSLAALVDIQARGLVRVQIVAFVARAYVAAQQIHAVVAAIMPAGQAFVHVHAVPPIVRHQHVAGWALAMVTTRDVYAQVRAAGFNVVLELLALIDVLAGSIVVPQSIAERTGAADGPWTVHFRMTMMGTVAVIALATVH